MLQYRRASSSQSGYLLHLGVNPPWECGREPQGAWAGNRYGDLLRETHEGDVP